MNSTYRSIIENYIAAYNAFDIDGMLADMDEQVRFENIANGEVNLATTGIAALREQARQARQYFKERQQTVTGFTEEGDTVEISIDYKATLAIDFPNGMKAGDKLELKGKSRFRFRNNKIIALKDIS